MFLGLSLVMSCLVYCIAMWCLLFLFLLSFPVPSPLLLNLLFVSYPMCVLLSLVSPNSLISSSFFFSPLSSYSVSALLFSPLPSSTFLSYLLPLLLSYLLLSPSSIQFAVCLIPSLLFYCLHLSSLLFYYELCLLSILYSTRLNCAPHVCPLSLSKPLLSSFPLN